MGLDVLVAGVVINEVSVELLALVHTPHGGAVHKTALPEVFTTQASLTQRLMQGYHTHQSGTGNGCSGLNAHCLSHLLIGHLDLTHREFRMSGPEVFELTYTGTVGHK